MAMFMKRIIPLVLFSAVMVSCVEYVEEPRYDYRERITGSYAVEEYSETFDEYVYYDMYLSKDYNTSDGIYLENFYADGISVYAYFNNDRITIPFQVTEGYEIEGHGTYSRGELDLHYSVRDRYSNSLTDYCDTYAYRE
jgi:hypothetical protein